MRNTSSKTGQGPASEPVFSFPQTPSDKNRNRKFFTAVVHRSSNRIDWINVYRVKRNIPMPLARIRCKEIQPKTKATLTYGIIKTMRSAGHIAKSHKRGRDFVLSVI